MHADIVDVVLVGGHVGLGGEPSQSLMVYEQFQGVYSSEQYVYS